MLMPSIYKKADDSFFCHPLFMFKKTYNAN